jgi:hypothetical protein
MLPLWTIITMLLIKDIASWRLSNLRVAAAILLLSSLVTSKFHSLKEWQQLHNRFQKGAIALMQIDIQEGQSKINIINPRKDRELAINEAIMLRNYHLSFYQKSTP